jgi:hypothetical protein
VQGCLITDFFALVVFETYVDTTLFKSENVPTDTLFDRVVLSAENCHLVLLDFVFFLTGYVFVVLPLSDLDLAFTAARLLTVLKRLDDVLSHASLVSRVEALSRLEHILLFIIINLLFADNTDRLAILFVHH